MQSDDFFLLFTLFRLKTLFHLDWIDCVLIGELEWMFAEAEEGWQETRIGNYVPAKGEGDVFVCTQTISVIPEVIFRVHILEIQNGVFTTQNDFVPEHDLQV